MRAYRINIKQPERDDYFCKQPEQNIKIGTYITKKANVVRIAKLLQRWMGDQVIVTVENVKLITSKLIKED